MLSVDGLIVDYGRSRALRGVRLSVNPGEIVGLLGSNGSGKTTTLKTIAGLLRATSGSMRWNNEDLRRLNAESIVRSGIALIPQGRQLFPELSVLDNLQMGAYQRSDKPAISADIDNLCAKFPVLAERRHQRAGMLSGGEQQILAIARALMSRPRLLMLDEPSVGLAPIIIKRIFAILGEINQAGTAILLVEQNASLALGLCQSVFVMENGKTVFQGTASALQANPKLLESAYLGVTS